MPAETVSGLRVIPVKPSPTGVYLLRLESFERLPALVRELKRALVPAGVRGLVIPVQPGETFEGLDGDQVRALLVQLAAALDVPLGPTLDALATLPGCWCPPATAGRCAPCGHGAPAHDTPTGCAGPLVQQQPSDARCATRCQRFEAQHDERCLRVRRLRGVG